MVKINVNLEDVPDGFFTAPEGIYHLKVMETSKLSQSKTGNAKIGWVCKIMDGELEEKQIYFTTSLVEEALWNVKGLVVALGVEWDEDGFDLEDCFDQEFMAKLSIRDWEGRDFQQAEGYTPVGGFPPETTQTEKGKGKGKK